MVPRKGSKSLQASSIEFDEESMSKTIFLRMASGVVLSIVLICVWYGVASNYGYGSLAGTYIFHGDGEICTLSLRPDQTYVEELTRSNETQKSQGQWHRYGQAHVSFSNEFLKLSREELNAEGHAHGQFEKTLGLLPTLVLAPLPKGPRFHRRLFR
jgi:hypothetical protein